MHLITALAAGIGGCEGGTVKICTRGTASYATVYSDWNGGATISNGSPLQLDAYGGLVAYVQSPVDVTAYNSTGTQIRTWTEAVSADMVEYRGASFTGVDPVTLAIGAGAQYPVSVDTVLDRWGTSASGVDFEVDVDGTDTPMADLWNAPFVYNVQDAAYGALGDGTTNDLVAINAAIAAAHTAGGGIVWFPPGTYHVHAAITWYRGVSLWGAGNQCATISLDVASGTHVLLVTDDAGTTPCSYEVRGLTVATVQACGCLIGDAVAKGDTLCIARSTLDGTNANYCLEQTGSSNTKISISDCVGICSLRFLSTLGVANITGCEWTGLSTSGSASAPFFKIYGGGTFSDNSVDVSAGTVDASSIIDCRVSRTEAISITGNDFVGNATYAATCWAMNVVASDPVIRFRETANTCTDITPVKITLATPYYAYPDDYPTQIQTDTRHNSMQVIGPSGTGNAGVTLDTANADTALVRSSKTAGTLEIALPSMPAGAEMTLYVHNIDDALTLPVSLVGCYSDYLTEITVAYGLTPASVWTTTWKSVPIISGAEGGTDDTWATTFVAWVMLDETIAT